MSWICHRCETENKEGLLYCEVCEEPSPHYSEIMREEEAWNNATQINTEDSYNSYLRIFPAGKYQIEAQHRISKLINEKELKAEDELWAKVVSKGTISAYDQYIKISKKRKYIKDANKKLEELLWSVATTDATESSYRDYLQKSELKVHKVEAEKRLEAILWEAAVKKNTLDSYREYKLKSPIIRKECEVNIQSIERTQWSIAVETDTISGYEKYLGYFTSGYHSSDARKRISELQDDECWSIAIKQNTLASYKSYLSSSNVAKRHSEEAHVIIEEILWKRAIERNTLEGYAEYKRSVKKPRIDLIKKVEDLEEQDWVETKKIDTLESYEKHIKHFSRENGIFDKLLKPFSTGKYVIQARERIKELTAIANDDVLWSRAKMSHSLTGFRNYLEASTLKIHKREAEERINEFDSQEWVEACKKHSIVAYQAYLKKYPNGLHSVEALEKIHRIEKKASILSTLKILLVFFIIAATVIVGVYFGTHLNNSQHIERSETRSDKPNSKGSTNTSTTGGAATHTETKSASGSNTIKIAEELEKKLKGMELAKQMGDAINPTTLRAAENLLNDLPESHSNYNKYKQRLNALK